MTFNLKRVIVGGAIVLAVGVGGFGTVAAANAATPDSSINVVSGTPGAVTSVEATKMGSSPSTGETGEGGVTSNGAAGTGVAGAVTQAQIDGK